MKFPPDDWVTWFAWYPIRLTNYDPPTGLPRNCGDLVWLKNVKRFKHYGWTKDYYTYVR